MGEPSLQTLRMMGAHRAADAALNADGERDNLSARHVVELGGMIDQLVHRQRDEVDEHDLDDRPEARSGGTDSQSHDGRLR